MASNKFVIKCGNFAVLVDVHILPQGSSKDTSWFSDHEKEEVCKLLEEVVASRVKHYLEKRKQRGQGKPVEHGSSGPLFLTANSLHITAYFMKRWVNLRCALGKRYRELRVFPEKFIVCVSKLDFDPSAWTCDSVGLAVCLFSLEITTPAAEFAKRAVCLHLIFRVSQSCGFMHTKLPWIFGSRPKSRVGAAGARVCVCAPFCQL